MNKKTFGLKSKIILVLSFLCVALAVLTAVNSARIKSLERDRENQQQKSLSELCESLDGITVGLQKSLYTGTEKKLRENGNELCRQAAVAKVSLSGITDENMITDNVYKFLSQVGDYMLYISDKKGAGITEKEYEQLKSLYEYSKSLSEAFEDISRDYYDGSISFSDDTEYLLKEIDAEKISLSDTYTDTQQTMGDYPTLLYDGPFADTVINREPAGLSGREITEEEAREAAGEALGCDPSALKREADIDSQISLYCFSLSDKTTGITKKGGYVCYITDSSYAGEAAISINEAVKRGKEYLKKIGFEEKMKETYYSTYDGICTVNYAYEDKGIIYYADLIKVSISLETGKPVALDSRGYLMNHTRRSFEGAELTGKQCSKALSPFLETISVKKAVIPLESGKEALCYEFHCKDEEGQEVLIYTDIKTGEELDIMLLLYSDDGVLTK